MKAYQQTQSISNQQSLRKCGKSFLALWLSQVLGQSLSDVLPMIQQTSESVLRSLKESLSSMTTLTFALADQGVAVLKNLISTREVNARLLVGLALVGIITPVADIMYTWMPKTILASQEVWYYQSFYWLFLSIGPYIQIVTGFLGAYFIMFPSWNKKAWLLMAPMCFALGKIIWLLTVTNHNDFLSVPPLAYFLYAFGFVALVVFISDYFAWRKYHRADAHAARMTGLIQLLDMSNPINKGIATTWEDIKNKNY